MKKQTKSNPQEIFFTAIAALVLMFAASSLAVAQGDWKRGEEWRGQYKTGDKVQFTISGNASDFQTCTVTQNEGKIIMRVRCDEFKSWSEGDYIVYGKSNIRPLQKTKTAPKNQQNEEETADETADETENNQTDWRANEKWRANYKVGDKVRFTISNKAADFQTCTVTENKPESVMRVKCNAFKNWEAGVYIVHSETNFTGEEITEAKPKNTTKQTGGNSTSLKIGEYACTGSGGRMMIGLGFKVVSGNRYTDLDGKRSGTFTISGGTITFHGGHLEGVTGRDLKNNWFRVASQAQCGPY